MKNNFSENNTAKYYDIIYKDWIDDDFTMKEFKMIKNLASGNKILDIGAGSGRHSELFEKSGFNVTCVEPLDVFYKILCKKLKAAKIFKLKFSEFESDKKYDVIISMWNAFHQLAFNFDEGLKTLAKMKKLLNTSGKIIFSLSPGEEFDVKDYNFTHEQIYKNKRYFLKWSVLSWDDKNNVVDSIEEISVFDENNNLIDISSAKIKQKYWTELELKDLALKLNLDLQIYPKIDKGFDNYYIFSSK